MTIDNLTDSRPSVPARVNSRDLALRKATALTSEIQKAARAARLARTPTVARYTYVAEGVQRALAVWKDAKKGLVASYIVVAFIPSVLCVLYFSLIASDQYASEARFAVRAGQPSLLDTLSSLTGIASMQQAQDSLIIADYVKSRAIVEELDKRIGLRAMYSKSDIDYVSRFNPKDPIEDLVRYWRWKIKTAIEFPSGIITVEVRAFTPQDSLLIANTIVALSEELINKMSTRAQRDLLALSESEVTRAEDRLRKGRTSLRDLRNQAGIIDPRKEAEGINRLIEQVKLDKIKMEQDLTLMKRSLSPKAPQMQILEANIQAADEQIATLEKKLTSQSVKGDSAISGAITRFDQLDLERQVAEKQFATAAASLEHARVTAERQQLYLNTFVHPVLAQEAMYPLRFWYSLASILVFFVVWAALSGGWAAIKFYVPKNASMQ